MRIFWHQTPRHTPDCAVQSLLSCTLQALLKIESFSGPIRSGELRYHWVDHPIRSIVVAANTAVILGDVDAALNLCVTRIYLENPSWAAWIFAESEWLLLSHVGTAILLRVRKTLASFHYRYRVVIESARGALMSGGECFIAEGVYIAVQRLFGETDPALPWQDENDIFAEIGLTCDTHWASSIFCEAEFPIQAECRFVGVPKVVQDRLVVARRLKQVAAGVVVHSLSGARRMSKRHMVQESAPLSLILCPSGVGVLVVTMKCKRAARRANSLMLIGTLLMLALGVWSADGFAIRTMGSSPW